MVLRCAAHLPIETADRDKPAFLLADSIVRVAEQQVLLAQGGLAETGLTPAGEDAQSVRP